MEQGYLALILHAHLPFVRHPERADYLEERWLFEAITDCYIPLLQVCQALVADNVDFCFTMSITPTLISMLGDELLQQRTIRYLNQSIALALHETYRTADMPDFYPLAVGYLERFKSAQAFYQSYDGNLLEAFREMQDAGKLEIITSAATHAFLPLIATEESVRGQLETGIAVHEAAFGKRPQGIWLPECGYAPGIDKLLAEYGIRYFFVDSHGLTNATPTPSAGTLVPVRTPHGVAAFGRDAESSKQVWSAKEGYPGDYDYREWYRDIGYDLDWSTLAPYLCPHKVRTNTGIKYFRITGDTNQKEPYRPDWAKEKAARHAENFVSNRVQQVDHWAQRTTEKPIVVAPFDAELFGHWWYEGPDFLNNLFRTLSQQHLLAPITPSLYLAQAADLETCSLSMSSWGRGGYAEVWLQGDNDWIYPGLHAAEQQMITMANRFQTVNPLEERALNQAARELMLAQSSDWAFIMDSKTMVDYAVRRVKVHINRFTHLHHMLQSGLIDESWLSEVESLDNLFPQVTYTSYRSRYPMIHHTPPAGETPPLRVLMLTWEFPPLNVGGLSRHVYDLSRHLVQQGIEIHVVTAEVVDAPHTEVVHGIHVHRVHVLQPDGGQFIHWIFQLNLMILDAVQMLTNAGLTFDIIHAHDWLVNDAARSLKALYGIPLVATIHATEHGRNRGIHSDLQRTIHQQEWELTYEAQRVIVCSQSMRREVETVFALPPEKIDVLPNGVDSAVVNHSINTEFGLPSSEFDGKTVLFIGRLVQEKGVQTLLEAIPAVLRTHPDTEFIIVGQGPARHELEALAGHLGISHNVRFTGFVSDDERNRLLHTATVAVFPSHYEPFGIVALEAMAAGTPVVVSDVGGLTDVVAHGHNGLKAYPGDVPSLTLQLQTLLSDDDYAHSLASTALAEINKFGWDKIASDTISIYHRVVIKHSMQQVIGDHSGYVGAISSGTHTDGQFVHLEEDVV